jgi:CRP-like cAMP-binding protein
MKTPCSCTRSSPQPGRSRAAKETLFRTDDTFDSLYAIRPGSVKTTVTHLSGREQVMGLHLSGDPLSLEGIDERRHACSAIALEDSSICVFPSRDSSDSAARPAPSSGACSRS